MWQMRWQFVLSFAGLTVPEGHPQPQAAEKSVEEQLNHRVENEWVTILFHAHAYLSPWTGGQKWLILKASNSGQIKQSVLLWLTKGFQST